MEVYPVCIPPTSESRRLSAKVLVRFEPSEHSRLVEEAAAAGLTLPALVRRRLAGQRVAARTDVVLIRELRRAGGIAMLAMRTRGMAHIGRGALADIRRAIAVIAVVSPP